MTTPPTHPPSGTAQLGWVVRLDDRKVLNPDCVGLLDRSPAEAPVLVVLAAGRGTRFGPAHKCIQPVLGRPLARHTLEAFAQVSPCPALCVVGYRGDEVSAALGPGTIYVRSDNPTGGTAFAAYEALSVPGLLEQNRLLVITMGDRIVPASVLRRLIAEHRAGPEEAALTFLTALYEPPKHHGKGRIVRGAHGRVVRLVEQRDIDALSDAEQRRRWNALTEGNCPLYAIRAATLHRHLRDLTNANAQGQYYLTDVVAGLVDAGGVLRTITTTVADGEYDLLCADVTRPMDLAVIEGILRSVVSRAEPTTSGVDEAARRIAEDRPGVQVAAIARQLETVLAAAAQERVAVRPDAPVAIGIAGGRLRIAFMHPDMVRFFGPAWQMPMGAGDPTGEEQILVVAQVAADGCIHLHPVQTRHREVVDSVPSDSQLMYPDAAVAGGHAYEEFGTRLNENLLLSLGYFGDDELEARRARGLPLPPANRWVRNSLRRPFSLVANAIASMRTLREGSRGTAVQAHLGRDAFRGLRLISTGNIPQGGFASSSAVTVATQNAINALFDLGLPPDLLVHLACQAEYGTGVRAGSLDQATEQKGRPGRGVIISSNPRDNYRLLGTFPVPVARYGLLFAYSVERDREAWRWSGGAYAEAPGPGRLTPGEFRKMTGKAAEIAALITGLPLDLDLFKLIEDDLVEHGRIGRNNRLWIASFLRQLPLCITRAELHERLEARREWLAGQFVDVHRLEPDAARGQADATLTAVLAGWRDPRLPRFAAPGRVVEEVGMPLRALVAYLFGEVAKNFHLVHHPEAWIEYVTLSQRGDRWFDLDPGSLPPREALERGLEWEAGFSGPALLDQWLVRHGATPVDYNRGIEDDTLSAPEPPEFHRLEGSNFFRGLALIDLAEAMLKRAFGAEAVAVRINAAGQGDYFQVHVDTTRADPEDVKRFLRAAFYRRFDLRPDPEFVAAFPGGGAVGVRLNHYAELPQLIERLRAGSAGAPGTSRR